MLSATGAFAHRPFHAGEQVVDAQARRVQVLEERRCERRVAAGAVRRHFARVRRIRDESLDRPAHRRQPPGRGGVARQSHRASQGCRQRIVAAGVQEHQIDPAAHSGHHVAQFHGAAPDIQLPLQPRIHRHQVVRAIHLQAVTRVEEQRHVRIPRPLLEHAHLVEQALAVEIGRRDDVEAEPAQHGGHVPGVRSPDWRAASCVRSPRCPPPARPAPLQPPRCRARSGLQRRQPALASLASGRNSSESPDPHPQYASCLVDAIAEPSEYDARQRLADFAPAGCGLSMAS